ncbi:MAG: DciA family protein [Pseudomonadota bacterium]
MSLRALGATLPKVTRAAFARRGRAFATLIAEWNAIVGPALAEVAVPERLLPAAKGAGEPGGVLSVRVSGAAALELQHLAPQILERVNVFLGTRAVARLKLIQAPIPGRAGSPVPARQLGAAEEAAVAEAVARVADPGLQAALARLGRALAAATPKNTRADSDLG